MRAGIRDDRILIETRLTAAALVPILLAAFVLLYLLPDDTGRLFAWQIEPRMTALIMGAGYLTGAYFFARLALGRRWHRAGIPLPAVAAFAATIMLVTIVHWDRFHHGTLAFSAWVLIYLIAPPLVALIWWRNRRTDPGTPEPDDVVVPLRVRRVLAVLGGLLLAGAILMFIWPRGVIDSWPWLLTPATARATAGWIVLPGAASLCLAADARWSAWRMPLEGTFIWAVLISAGLFRAWDNFDPARAATWLTVGVLVVWIVALAAFYGRMERRRRGTVPRGVPEEGVSLEAAR
jgi:hypothetical protein